MALILLLVVQSTCVCAVHKELVAMQRRWPNRACSGAKRDKERIALHLATATATWARCVAHRQHQSIVALRGGVGSVPFSASANAETSKLAAQSPWQVLWTLSLPDLHLVILALVALTLAGQSSEKPFDKVTLYSTNARALAFEHWWCLHWQRLVRLHSHTPTHPHPPTDPNTHRPPPPHEHKHTHTHWQRWVRLYCQLCRGVR